MAQGNAAPIDPNVKIPAAVTRGAANSDAIHKAAYNTESPTAAAPAPAPAPAPIIPAAPAPAPPPPPAAGDPPADEATWELRYKSIKGRYDKAQSTMNEQQGAISTLQNEVSNLQRLLAAAPPAPAASAPAELTAASLTTPEERDQYGAEFMDVVARRAQEAVAPKFKTLEDENAELRRQLGGVTNVVVGNERQRMLTRLDEQLPDWKIQNEDPKFLSWLRLPDPYSGVNRGELLKTAFGRNEADRVLTFFKGFLTEEATVAPASSAAAIHTGGPSLADLAAPGRAKSAAPANNGNGSPEKPVISRAQIAQFYADVRARKYEGRDKEKNDLEAQIFAAERDGRIV